ncbi:hypothetical protein PV392_09630 [Streptomyces sp. ME03-5709C]|nr:hypothetical protein [Streptomyces sp. ME03-5709C]
MQQFHVQLEGRSDVCARSSKGFIPEEGDTDPEFAFEAELAAALAEVNTGLGADARQLEGAAA